MKKQTSLYKYILVFCFLGFISFLSLVAFFKRDTRIPPAQIPAQTESYFKQRDQACPILKASTESLLNSDLTFEITNVYCDYDSEIKLGYDYIDVEINNVNFDEGKSDFQRWLRSYELQESDTLRIKYIHKPN